jgi:filamentous hemagglutinin family protein
MASFPDTGPRLSRLTRRLMLCGLLWLWALLAVGQAAVTSAITGDGTLGTTVTRSGTMHTITRGTRPGNGPNLFHSFDRFSVGTADTARFSGPTGITNILSRITGGQQSIIDGRLQSTIPGANLYLLNPSGVLFGPQARLEVSGSFHVSTADVLRLADGATFSAHLGPASVLTVAEPAAFGFLGNTPAPITMQGSSLQVPTGKILSLLGGDLTIIGSGPLTAGVIRVHRAPGGRVQLASVASPGEVGFSPLELAPDLQAEAFARLGRMALSQAAFLDTSGNGGGTVLFRSGQLLVDGSSIWVDNTGNLDGMGPGLDLRITGEALLTNEAGILSSSGFGTAGGGVSSGRARDLQLTARSLRVMGNSTITSGQFLGGPGFFGRSENIVVQVGTLTLTGGRSSAALTA